MKVHGLIRRVISSAQTTPVRGLRRPLPGDPPIWAKRGLLITALVLGCLGAGATVLPAHADTRLTASSSIVGPSYFIGPAWMY
jgi:hypothetical protein